MRNKLFGWIGGLALLFCMGLLPQTASAQTLVSLGYFSPGDGISINNFSGTWGGMTHLVIMACWSDSNGVVSCTGNPSSDFPALVSAAHANGKKALININDLGGSANLFAAAQNHLSTVVANIMAVVNAYGFDGVELDWEGTLDAGSSTVTVSFTQAMRNALGTKWFSATAFPCCSGGRWQGSIPYLDRLSLMTYDMGGANSSFCWYNSSLYNPVEFPTGPNNQNDGFSTDGSVTFYESWGWPAAKLNIGIPFYGDTHSSATTARHSCGGASQTHYNTFVNNQGWPGSAIFDSEAGAYWKSIAGGYIDAETPTGIQAKVNYVRSHGLGGLMEFEINSDYLSGSTPHHPLMAAIQTALGTASTAPNPPTNLTVTVR